MDNREAKSGHPIDLPSVIYHQDDLQAVILKGIGLQHLVYNNRARCAARLRVTRFSFDWQRVREDAKKFKAIPCPKERDRVFIYKAIALTQTTIPEFAVWDALEAVKQIGPTCPIAYFRAVLRDNCRKADVDLDAALRSVRVPKNFV